jgi:hypothetical protein
LGGQSVGRFPIRFALETYRSQYRYFYKHYGKVGMLRMRRITILNLYLRFMGYTIRNWLKSSESLRNRLQMYGVTIEWNRRLNPMRFIERGEEPNLGYEPMAPAPKLVNSTIK